MQAITPTAADTARFWTKVDTSGPCWIWIAGKTRRGYGVFGIWQSGKSHTWMAHRYAYRLVHGDIDSGMDVDHMCHNPSCVNVEHLRVTTRKQNLENRAGLPLNNKSGVRGVHWVNAISKWRAVVKHSGRQHFVGHFSDIAEAETAVIAKRNELFTHNDVDRSVA